MPGIAEHERTPDQHIVLNDPEWMENSEYPTNVISTAKYNVVSFVPLFLFQQFSQMANVYFLVLILLQTIEVITSVTFYTTLAPLVLIFCVIAFKELKEDGKRHDADDKVNKRIAYSIINEVDADTGLYWQKIIRWFRKPKFMELNPDDENAAHQRAVEWQHMRVGDIVRVEMDDPIPADMVVLMSSEEDGSFYVDTAELDGETNLKLRRAVDATKNLSSPQELRALRAEIKCEGPNVNMHRFCGSMIIDGHDHTISNDNIVLRGSSMRTTEVIYGVIVYAGDESKLMRSAHDPAFKRTRMSIALNKYLCFIFCTLLVVSAIGGINAGIFEGQNRKFLDRYVPIAKDNQFNSAPNGYSPAMIGFLYFFTFIITLSTFIPISLYVEIEISRVLQAFFIENDRLMYHKESNTSAKVRTSTLNEELGQIEYIFSDKTGTLTQNKMDFLMCCIRGKTYGAMAKGNVPISFVTQRYADPDFKFYDSSLLRSLEEDKAPADHDNFFRILALCHTVQLKRESEMPFDYTAESPDEAALVAAARNFGYVFVGRTAKEVSIQIQAQNETMELLHTIEFNSDRKRMSVLVRGSDNKVKLLIKGADNKIMERLKSGVDEALLAQTTEQLREYSVVGLRTLLLAERVIPDSTYNEWAQRYHTAENLIEGREEALDKLAEEIEVDLRLVGITAIEDKLQDGVPQTIYTLADAGIKIWVLTGDKQETAINIGRSASLIREGMDVAVVNATDVASARDQILAIEDRIDATEGLVDNMTLVIDGPTLVHAMNVMCSDILVRVALRVKAVIACRVSPAQKSELVEAVQAAKDAVCLAIGDGGNDVPMIQAAQIGVGISGEEGRAAVNNSDFAIAQFRFLMPLLLVHGRWSHIRFATFYKYFFYKNVAMVLCSFWYNIYAGFSGTPAFLSLYITFFNALYTALPPFDLCTFQQDVDHEISLRYPMLYSMTQQNQYINTKSFILSVLYGIYNSVVIFFVTYLALSEDDGCAFKNGLNSNGYQYFAVTIAYTVTVVVNAQYASLVSHWTFTPHFAFWISVLGFPFISGACDIINWDAIVGGALGSTDNGYFGISLSVLSTPIPHFVMFLSVILCVAPGMIYRYAQRMLAPTNSVIVQEMVKYSKVDVATELRYQQEKNKGKDATKPLIQGVL